MTTASPPPAPCLPLSGLAASGGSQVAVDYDSRALFNGKREIVIRHGEERYRLRCTRNDKLILTK
jgi:hypothetical protein